MAAIAAATCRAAAGPPQQPRRPLLPPRTVLLPNGLRVRFVSRRDVEFLHREVYEQACYLRHGVALPPGGTVLDVGANIGLFSLRAAELLGPRGHVVACEPLAQTHECLQANIAAHQRWWAASGAAAVAAGAAGAAVRSSSSSGSSGRTSTAPAPITAMNVGVGDGSAAAASFTFYPRAAGWSSMHADEAGVQADMAAFLENALQSREAAAEAGLDPLAAAVGAALRSAAPRWAYAAARRAAVAWMLGGARRVACPLLSVAQLVEQQGLAGRGIDLLKIDVERAELAVLHGVGDCWPLVRQVAMEAHEASLEPALRLLRSQGGFTHVVVEQEGPLAGTSLHAVYAWR